MFEDGGSFFFGDFHCHPWSDALARSDLLALLLLRYAWISQLAGSGGLNISTIRDFYWDLMDVHI